MGKQSARKQHKAKQRRDRHKKQTFVRRERDRYPEILILNDEAPDPVIEGIRKAIGKISLGDKRIFPQGARKFFKDQKAGGFGYALRHRYGLRDQDFEDRSVDSKQVRIENMYATVLGNLLIRYAVPDIRSYIPKVSFSVLPDMKFGRNWTIWFSALRSQPTPNGRIYYSTKEHTATVNGEEKKMSFTNHSIERSAARAFRSLKSFIGMGDSHGVFQCCTYYEQAQLANGSRTMPAVSFYIPIQPSYPSWKIVEACLGDLVIPDMHYYWRVGYFPLADFRDFWVAKTFLLPGYRGTPERALIRQDRSISWAQEKEMEKTFDDLDIDRLAWFHKRGVPQVKAFDEELYDLSPLMEAIPDHSS